MYLTITFALPCPEYLEGSTLPDFAEHMRDHLKDTFNDDGSLAGMWIAAASITHTPPGHAQYNAEPPPVPLKILSAGETFMLHPADQFVWRKSNRQLPNHFGASRTNGVEFITLHEDTLVYRPGVPL